ncbi:MAG: hypothetical protein ACR2GL_05480 [Thermoleophilaceae bacterium]
MSRGPSTTARALAPVTVLIVVLAALAGGAAAQTLGRTTAQGNVVPGPSLDPAKPGFLTLAPGPGSAQVLRELPRAKAQGRRERRRRSLAYFAQLSDFQLTDEESPARVEQNAALARSPSIWRPQEALLPAAVDLAIRQLNQFTFASPNRGAGGRRAGMDFALLTGDQTDNQQLNEVSWARRLIEGGQVVDPNSGTRDFSRCTLAQRTALGRLPFDEPQRYTGVQDHSDYNGGSGDFNFYDPDRPGGPLFASWPRYEGLMDRAQRPFVASGLRRGAAPVPTYLSNGNHDSAVQGNHSALANSEKVATGCLKPFASGPSRTLAAGTIFAREQGFAVPPDENRRFVDRVEAKRVYAQGIQPDAHGFGFVDPAQNAASGFAASYYAWDPKPRLRFISLDTVAEGGAAVGSPQGNLDDPQFRWLQDELARARAERKIVVVFGHHGTRALRSGTPDEAATPCRGGYTGQFGPYTGPRDRHGHDRDPGCDLDPRASSPIHLGDELAGLLSANENVVAYVTGHSHANRVAPCGRRRGCEESGNWWEINTAATADWPQQQRLLEVMDNRDGTLSILGIPVDQGAAPGLPAPGAAATFGEEQLAALARGFAYNDQRAPKSAIGAARDRNVELIVKDPRAGDGAGICALPRRRRVAGKRVDRARLGRARRASRRAYPARSLDRKTSTVDRFCMVGGGQVRIGYPSAGLRRGLERRERRRVRGRAVLALTSTRAQHVRGLRAGSSRRAVRRRLRGERRYRVGGAEWYLARARRARVVVKLRRGRVVQLGLADPGLTGEPRLARRFLRSFAR